MWKMCRWAAMHIPQSKYACKKTKVTNEGKDKDVRAYRKKSSGKGPEYKAYICNRYASGGKDAGSSNSINQKVL